MIQAGCPNCGNTVTFHSEFSTHAVCAFCDTLMVRRDSGVENLGKVAEIQQDGSPLQLGVQGEYQGRNFQVVGRIQLRYQDGYWNEWHLIYSNGESGWLGEAMGEYFVSFARPSQRLRGESRIALGKVLEIDDQPFAVTGQTENRLSSYEGELPFIVDTEQAFRTYDLRSTSGKAATIDYSDEPPSIFVGEYVPFAALKLKGLRGEGEPPDPSMGVRVPAQSASVEKFNCPTCGAPQSVEGGVRSKLLVCKYCGSAVDVTSSSLNVVWQEERMRKELRGGTSIPLGSRGRIEGVEYKVIGYLKKSVTYEGVKYPWIEYLLYNFTSGYRWLVESDGHFTLMETIADLPAKPDGAPVARPGREAIHYQGEVYRHFQTSTPRVDALAGEFYWRVKVGDTATNFDYISPPRTLSMEASEHGFVWARGVYKTPEEIRALFQLEKEPRAPVGVAPAQPNPYKTESQGIWRIFWVASILGFFLLASGLLSGSSGEIVRTKGETYETFRANPVRTSAPFELKGRGNVVFDFSATLSNRWLFIDTTLVNQETKATYPVGITLENFYGRGSQRETVRVSGIPNGTYVLSWQVQSGTTSTVAEKPDPGKKSERIGYSVKLRRGAPVWGWYVLMVIALLPIPLYLTAKASSFETKRWYSSDYG